MNFGHSQATHEFDIDILISSWREANKHVSHNVELLLSMADNSKGVLLPLQLLQWEKLPRFPSSLG